MTVFQDALSKLWHKLGSWIEHFVLIMPNFVVAIIVLVIFWFAASLACRVSESVFRRVFRSKDVAWLVSMVVWMRSNDGFTPV